MKYFPITAIISCLVIAALTECCMGAPLLHETMAASGLPQQIELALIQRWMAFAVLGAGMALIIYQASCKRPYGIAGTTGLLLIGAIYAARVTSGISSFTGIIIFAAGILLIITESWIIPGHGVFAAGGIACLFAGTYTVLGGHNSGIWFPSAMAFLVSGSSAIAFIIHLPNNRAWQAMRKKIAVEESQSAATMQIDTSRMRSGCRPDASRGKERTACIKEKVGAADTILWHETQPTTSSGEHTTNTIESLRMRLSEIEAYAVPIIANQHNLELQISRANEILAKSDIEVRKAVEAGEDKRSAETLLGVESCRSRISGLEQQLAKAELHADAARQHVQDFRNDLIKATAEALNSNARKHLILMQSQFSRIAPDDMKAIDGIADQADSICASADIADSMVAEGGNHHLIHQRSERKQRADKALADLKADIHSTGTSEISPNGQTTDSQSQKLGRNS